MDDERRGERDGGAAAPAPPPRIERLRGADREAVKALALEIYARACAAGIGNGAMPAVEAAAHSILAAEWFFDAWTAQGREPEHVERLRATHDEHPLTQCPACMRAADRAETS